MKKSVIKFFVICLVIFSFNFSFAQTSPIEGVSPVLISVSEPGGPSFNSCYRGANEPIFYEPTTGYLIATWYLGYPSSDPDPRRITAAVSLDGGQSWTVQENVNLGVGANMNGYYPTCKGNAQNPILVYRNMSTSDANIVAQPVLSTDAGGWGVGLWYNTFIDNIGTADTVLDIRYYSLTMAPDNPNLWLIGAYHNSSAAPGEYLVVYRSEDAGASWSRPIRWASALTGDAGSDNYIIDLSTSTTCVELVTGNKAYAVGLGQYYSDDDLWRLIISTSSDGGKTWSKPSIIPGTDALDYGNGRLGRNFHSILDKNENLHIFAIGVDTLDATEQVCTWDFRFDGTVWNINRFVYPQLIDEGIVARNPNNSTWPMNNASVGPDGAMYYAYCDVTDTTGASGNTNLYQYKMFVMMSEDNGTSWKGPLAVLEDWSGRGNPNGMARSTSDKVHIIFREYDAVVDADSCYYMGIPTEKIKALLTSVDQAILVKTPLSYQLYQNYPNPFNPTTTIRFDLMEQAHVTIKIFNELGQEITTLLDRTEEAGFKGVTWDASGFPSGVYFYQLKAGSYFETKKMVLAR